MKQPFFIIIAALSAIVMVVKFLIMPVFEDVSSRRTVREEKKEIIIELENLKKKTAQWRVDFSKAEESIVKMNLALPDEEDFPNLIVALENLAGSSGVILGSIDFGSAIRGRSSAVKSDEVNALTSDLTMQVRGTYEAFKLFLDKIESNVRVIDIQSINFSSDSAKAGIFDFTILAKVYHQ